MLDIPSGAEQYERARELQRKRMNPANGIVSSELDIIAEPEARKRRIALSLELARVQRYRVEMERIAQLKEAWERAMLASLASAPQHQITPDDLRLKHRVYFREIILAVSEFYRITVLDLVSVRRTANIVRPRQITCYLAKSLTTLSLPQIGMHMGGRDHTTILHAVRKIEMLITIDRELSDEVEYIRKSLCGDASNEAIHDTLDR